MCPKELSGMGGPLERPQPMLMRSRRGAPFGALLAAIWLAGCGPAGESNLQDPADTDTNANSEIDIHVDAELWEPDEPGAEQKYVKDSRHRGRIAAWQVQESSCPEGYDCDNSSLRVVDQASAEQTRQALIDYIWKGRGLPLDRQPDMVEAIAPSEAPLPEMANIESMERIEVSMPLEADEGGGMFTSIVYRMIPTTKNNRLAIFHQGHAHAFDASGGGGVIEHLIARGFEVVAFKMPLLGENSAPAGFIKHNDMMVLESETRSPIQFFIEPLVVVLSYLKTSSTYDDISMIGISGGGWTTHLYAAIDPSIKYSFPVAGSLPIDLRDQNDRGDGEQEHAPLYQQVAGYRDLYALAAFGPGRIQTQILNLYDRCCFDGTQYRAYENKIREIAGELGGTFQVYLDATHEDHTVSEHVLTVPIDNVLHNGNEPLLDDGDSGFGYAGSSFAEYYKEGPWSMDEQGLASDCHLGDIAAIAHTLSGKLEAAWQFKRVQPGSYGVYASWSPGDDRTTAAKYLIIIDKRVVETVHVDQRQQPSDVEMFGQSWQRIAGLTRQAAGEVTIMLSGQGGGLVVADAIWLRSEGSL